MEGRVSGAGGDRFLGGERGGSEMFSSSNDFFVDQEDGERNMMGASSDVSINCFLVLGFTTDSCLRTNEEVTCATSVVAEYSCGASCGGE